jgi:hypothetical protein
LQIARSVWLRSSSHVRKVRTHTPTLQKEKQEYIYKKRARAPPECARGKYIERARREIKIQRRHSLKNRWIYVAQVPTLRLVLWLTAVDLFRLVGDDGGRNWARPPRIRPGSGPVTENRPGSVRKWKFCVLFARTQRSGRMLVARSNAPAINARSARLGLHRPRNGYTCSCKAITTKQGTIHTKGKCQRLDWRELMYQV